MSFRADPIKWLLYGRLPIAAEIAPLSFLSFQLTPIFVTNTSPPVLNLSGREDNLSQHANWVGPIPGASLGVGFWLQGKPFKGYVLRVVYNNYSYTYKTRAEDGRLIDHVNYVERQLLGEIASYSRIGAFIIGGGLQLGTELNKKGRCVDISTSDQITDQRCDDLEVVVDDKYPGTTYNLRSSWHPVIFDFSFTLGVAF